MLKECYILLIKSKIIMIVFILALLLGNVLLGMYFYNYVLCPAEDSTCYDLLELTLKLSICWFYVISSISYEYFKKINISGTNEIVAMLSTKKLFFCQFVVMLSIVALFLMVVIFWNIAAYIVICPDEVEILWIRIENCIVYYGILDIFGILLGKLVVDIKHSRNLLVVLVLVYILYSPINVVVADTVSNLRFNLYSVVKWFQIMPQYLSWSPNWYCPYSVKLGQIFLLIMWIYIALIIILKRMAIIRKKSVMLMEAILLIVFVILANNCDVGFVSGWNVEKSAAGHNYLYYEKNESKEEKVNFNVTSYDMNLKFYNKLYANVKIKVDETNQNDYKFTLYHQYKVSKICNAAGEKLKYKRDGDYIEVLSNGDMSTISFYYRGEAAGFSSVNNNVYLPAYFCYYPLSGYRSVYNNITREFNMNNIETTYFSVKTNQKIWTNLDSKGNKCYEGYSNGVEIVDGILKSVIVGNYTIIYPYSGYANLYSTDVIKDETKKLINTNASTTIFISPSINSARQYTFGSGWMDIQYLGDNNFNKYYDYYMQNGENLPNNYFVEEYYDNSEY